MTERAPTVLLLTAGGPNPAIVANALATRFPGLQVVLEGAESKWGITRRRARRLGWPNALGQLATTIAARLLRRLAARRTADLVASSGYSAEFSSAIPQHEVSSINDESCVALVQALQPKAILLVSTRLMSPAVLSSMPCPVINLHAGINPAYRGQMGGYWSLVERDSENFGATVHLVDAGTDTGGTLYEVRTTPEKGDFISTYPLVLTIAALDITRQAVEDAVAGRLSPHQPGGPSALRFPPAIWDWLCHGLVRGVW